MSNYTIRLSRPGLNGPARIYRIQLDGFDVGKLGARSTIDIPSGGGTHTVAFCWAGKTERIINVTLNEENPMAEINVTLDMMGKLNLSLVSGVTAALPQQDISRGFKPKKKMGCLSAVGIILSVFIVIVIVGAMVSGSNSKKSSPKVSERPSTVASTPAPTAAPAFTPVTGYVGNWEITVNDFSFQDDVSVGLLHHYESSENGQYCLVNVTVKNLGKEADTFLPYVTFGDMATAKIEWNGYEYTRSELFLSNDNLSSEQLNPLVTATGNIAFDVPDDLINSDTPPTFVIQAGNKRFSCELVKQ